jgi:prophage DNA circulation protein
MFNIAKLPEASYNDVRFLYQSSSINGGRKTVTHEYPNSDIRFVEDLGGLRKTYNIEAIIDNNSNNNQRDALITALDAKNILGKLVHPEYGVKQVKLINYTINNSKSSLGITSFSIVFEEADQPVVGKIASNTGFLSRLRSIAGENISNKLESGWNTFTRVKEGFDKTNQIIGDTGREIGRVAGLVAGAGDGVNDFATSINEIVNNTQSLVNSPSVLAGRLTNSFNALEVAFDNAEDVFNSVKNLIGFKNDEVVTGDSQTRQATLKNQALINNLISVNTFAIAYNQAAQINYKNQDDLNSNIKILEDGFKNITGLDRDSQTELQRIRIEFQKVTNDLSISLPKVSDFTTNKIPLNVLTYQLYASLDKKNDIKDLNKFRDTNEIKGTIKILSNG